MLLQYYVARVLYCCAIMLLQYYVARVLYCCVIMLLQYYVVRVVCCCVVMLLQCYVIRVVCCCIIMLLQCYVIRALCCCVIMLSGYYTIAISHRVHSIYMLIINVLQLLLSNAYNFTITIYILLYDTESVNQDTIVQYSIRLSILNI